MARLKLDEVAKPFYTEIGARVKMHREKRGMTQAGLALLAGCTRGSIANIEAGRQKPTVYTLTMIAMQLRVEVIDLIPHLPIEKHAERLREVQRKELSKKFGDFFN